MLCSFNNARISVNSCFSNCSRVVFRSLTPVSRASKYPLGAKYTGHLSGKLLAITEGAECVCMLATAELCKQMWWAWNNAPHSALRHVNVKLEASQILIIILHVSPNELPSHFLVVIAGIWPVCQLMCTTPAWVNKHCGMNKTFDLGHRFAFWLGWHLWLHQEGSMSRTQHSFQIYRATLFCSTTKKQRHFTRAYKQWSCYYYVYSSPNLSHNIGMHAE